MTQFRVPEGKRIYTANLTDFLGVDFTSVDVDPKSF